MARPIAPTPSVDDIHRAVREAFADAAVTVARRDAADARARYLRRQLEAAAEHGAALLSALDLPRLVTPDFVPLDRAAISEAVDAAVTALDAMESDPDLEDGGDAEPSLASPERHPFVPVSTWGRAWTARGGDESQLRWAEGGHHDRELVDEDKAHDDDELDGAGEVDAEPSIGWSEDFAAKVTPTLNAGADAEHDDVDLEDDELGDDRDPEPLAWVFGPSRREVAHV